jgi:hypothetical protein
MIVVRTVMQARFGRGGELAAQFIQTMPAMIAEMGEGRRWRLLTDLNGQFDTVVLEAESGSMSEWEQMRPRLFGSRVFRESMQRMQELVVSGRNEMWTVEGEG